MVVKNGDESHGSIYNNHLNYPLMWKILGLFSSGNRWPPKRPDIAPPRTHSLPSPILTWNLKMMVSKRNLLFQGAIFRFHVKLLEGRSTNLSQVSLPTAHPHFLQLLVGSKHILHKHLGHKNYNSIARSTRPWLRHKHYNSISSWWLQWSSSHHRGILVLHHNHLTSEQKSEFGIGRYRFFQTDTPATRLWVRWKWSHNCCKYKTGCGANPPDLVAILCSSFSRENAANMLITISTAPAM